MSKKNKGLWWLAIILSFIFGFWHIGLALMFLMLFVKPKLKRDGTFTAVIGAILFFLGAILGVTGLISAIISGINKVLSNPYALPAFLFVVLLLCVGGGVLNFMGRKQKRQLGRFEKYKAIIGDRASMPIDSIAAYLPASYDVAVDDLQTMIDKGELVGAYIDAYNRTLVFPEKLPASPFQPIIEVEPEPVTAAETTEEDVDSPKAILDKIERINRDIDNPELSAKIDRIRDLTEKILTQTENKPQQKPRIRKFMNYYLPTTLKILDAYSRYEEQGIDHDHAVLEAFKELT